MSKPSRFSPAPSTQWAYPPDGVPWIGSHTYLTREVPLTQYIAAIDQGTTSTRCMVFDPSGSVVSVDQLEHRQIFPRAGWVEHDGAEIWRNTQTVVARALDKADLSAANLAAVGISNQRETTIVWDKATGEPVHHAIVWQDTRTQRICDDLARSGRCPALPGGDGAAVGDVLLGTEGALDPRRCRRCPGAGRGG